jgi:hypothetical protein|mmetsp:Transcript_5894/g.9554  ORF Transcript_5894/g.9554 Transcript_5894/m.9554 type:complete len:314 (-) Transcript_5894:216-1157(-)
MAAVPVVTSIEQLGQGPLSYMIVPVMDAQFAEPCIMYQPYGEYGEMWCPPYQYQGWYDTSKGSRSSQKRNSRSSACGPISSVGGRGNGYQTDEDISVVLSGLPQMLCSDACLKAMFEQANVENGVQSFTVDESKNGKAIVVARNMTFAQTIISHFEGLRCGQKITAQFLDPIHEQRAAFEAEHAQNELLRTNPRKKDIQAARHSKVREAPMRKQSFKSAAEPVKKDECKTVAAIVAACEAHPAPPSTPPFSPVRSSPPLTPIRSALTNTSLQKRWADMNDDSDSDSDETQSTNAGPVRSFSDAMESSSNPDEI